MIEIIQTVLALILTISILVTIHEFGHYWVARLCGVHVVRFCVGFGKPIYSIKGRAPDISAKGLNEKGYLSNIPASNHHPVEGTEFALAAIPLGGYVKFLDEREAHVPESQLHLAFNRKPASQRIAIAAAGPAANFLLAIAAYWLLFASGVSGVVPILGPVDESSRAGKAGLHEGQEIVAVDSESTRTWSDVNLRLFDRLGETGEIIITVREKDTSDAYTDYVVEVTDWLSHVDEPSPARDLGLTLNTPKIPSVIDSVSEEGRARRAGLVAGDHILQVDRVVVRDWPHLVDIIQRNPERSLPVTVKRENMTFDVVLTPEGVMRDGRLVGFIGASVRSVRFPEEMRREVSYSLSSALFAAIEKTYEVTAFTLSSIEKMIIGAISPKNLSGPITIAQVANATVENGLESFIGFIALLSISLGVINLLPIPVLDGGHLLYYFIEIIVGRPVPEKVQMWGLQLGMVMIVSIMLLAFYNDLTRL